MIRSYLSLYALSHTIFYAARCRKVTSKVWGHVREKTSQVRRPFPPHVEVPAKEFGQKPLLHSKYCDIRDL